MADLKQPIAPITLTFDGLVQNAVSEELKRRAVKTAAGQAMKTAGLEDIKILLTTFGITPALIEKGVTLAFKYLEAQAEAKGGYSPPGGTPGPTPGYSAPPPPPRTPPPPPVGTIIDPAVMHRNHMGLMQSMINTYGDIPLSEAMKRFDAEKGKLIESARQAQGAAVPQTGSPS